MKNLIQKGEIMEYANAGSAILSGGVVVLGNRIAIANEAIAASTGSGSVQLEGVFSLPSITSGAFVQGEELFWDAGNTRLTNIGTGSIPAGTCFEAKASSTATAKVLLEPVVKRVEHLADASAGSAAEINALRDALILAGIMKSSQSL